MKHHGAEASKSLNLQASLNLFIPHQPPRFQEKFFNRTAPIDNPEYPLIFAKKTRVFVI